MAKQRAELKKTALILWLFVGCAGAPVRPMMPPAPTLESLYQKGAWDELQSKAGLLLSQAPDQPSGIENLSGLAYLRMRKPALAVKRFKDAIRHGGPADYLRYNLATAFWDLGQWENAYTQMQQIRLDQLERGAFFKAVVLKAATQQKKSLFFESAQEILKASEGSTLSDLKENRPAIERLLQQALQQVSPDKRASLITQLGMFKALAPQEQSPLPISNFDLSQKTPSPELQSVGVLLPLQGKMAKFGAKSLQGIQLAFDIFRASQAPSTPDSKITLVVEDSGDDADHALQGLHRLVFNHKVVAVIGPMLSKGVERLSERAHDLGVPLISLARKASPSGDYVIQAGMTQQLQASEMARHAIQKLGYRSFALLYPKDKLSSEMANAFWNAVDLYGGRISGAESYSPEETDFREVVDRLSGLYYTQARQDELDALAQQRDLNHITKMTWKTERYFHLKPVVDYEAVFIADDGKKSSQVFPTFAYRDVDRVMFLGPTAWNSPEFVSRAQAYGERSFFVDAYFPSGHDPVVEKFIQKFKGTYSQEPSQLEALAYDAGSILRTALSRGVRSRSDLKDELKKVKNHPGVTGTISYQQGHFIRPLHLLTISQGQIVEAP